MCEKQDYFRFVPFRILHLLAFYFTSH